MSKIADALERFQANGDGSAVTDEDMQAVTEYMINKLVGSGVPIREAADIISLHKWGSWSQGWETGYDSAKSHYTRRFSLGSDYGQVLRDAREV